VSARPHTCSQDWNTDPRRLRAFGPGCHGIGSRVFSPNLFYEYERQRRRVRLLPVSTGALLMPPQCQADDACSYVNDLLRIRFDCYYTLDGSLIQDDFTPSPDACPSTVCLSSPDRTMLKPPSRTREVVGPSLTKASESVPSSRSAQQPSGLSLAYNITRRSGMPRFAR